MPSSDITSHQLRIHQSISLQNLFWFKSKTWSESFNSNIRWCHAKLNWTTLWNKWAWSSDAPIIQTAMLQGKCFTIPRCFLRVFDSWRSKHITRSNALLMKWTGIPISIIRWYVAYIIWNEHAIIRWIAFVDSRFRMGEIGYEIFFHSAWSFYPISVL